MHKQLFFAELHNKKIRLFPCTYNIYYVKYGDHTLP